MTRPNTMFDRERDDEFRLEPEVSLSPARLLDGLDEDMKAVGAALLDAMRAFVALKDGSGANDPLECRTAATKLDNLITRRLVERVRHVTTTVKGRL